MNYQALTKEKQIQLQKRLNRLEKKFAGRIDEATEEDLNEVRQIELILEQLSRLDGLDDEEGKRNMSITTSPTEEWYRTILMEWFAQHPSAVSTKKLTKSYIYSFLLHFFVDNVVLNPDNAGLGYESLVTHLNEMTQPNSDWKKVGYDLADLKTMTALILSMQYEVNTAPVSGNARQLTPQSIAQLRTDINKKSDVGMAIDTFEELRNQDKRALHKRQ